MSSCLRQDSDGQIVSPKMSERACSAAKSAGGGTTGQCDVACLLGFKFVVLPSSDVCELVCCIEPVR